MVGTPIFIVSPPFFVVFFQRKEPPPRLDGPKGILKVPEHSTFVVLVFLVQGMLLGLQEEYHRDEVLPGAWAHC
jgi:hypothetical protein